MDLRELVHALQGTMHPEEGIRKAAEAALSKVPRRRAKRSGGVP